MRSRKKRKFKKGFKRFLLFLFLIIFIGIIFLLNQKKVIDLNNIWENTKSIFIRENSENIDNINNKTESTDFVNLFKNRLASRGFIFASSSEISSHGDIKIFLMKDDFQSGYIYINTKDGAGYAWITFISAIDAEPLKTKLKNDFKNLEYIDLRFSNKIFYKFRNKDIDLFKNNIIENKREENYQNIDSDSSTTPLLIENEEH